MKKLQVVIVALFILAAIIPVQAATKSGRIYTTLSDCSEQIQNENHYATGDLIYLHGEGFKEGEHEWSITGLPGQASSDPNQVVAFGTVMADSQGSFCFAAYEVQPGDDGEYKANVANKKDNYRVEGETSELTCEEAIEEGLLIGNIEGGAATVTNNANSNYLVSLVSYKMYAAIIEDQAYYDSETEVIEAGDTEALMVDVPACAYQVDLVCGEPIIGDAPFYGERIIDTEIVNGNFCIWEPQSSREGIWANLSVVDPYPINDSYVFECTANGFLASSYNWYFGDGEFLLNTTLDSVFHSYSQGDYTVACRATDGVDWAVDTLNITIS